MVYIQHNLKWLFSVSNETLLELYAYFGNTLSLATELLEKCKIFKYFNQSKSRTIFKIGCNSEWYTIYENINFCRCASFQTQVLEDKTILTCKHVLAVKLNTITGACNIRSEEVTDSQFVNFLNAQLKKYDDE